MATTANRSYTGTVGKSRIEFFCTECCHTVTGWPYEIGLGIGERREVCAACWATPRIPPMKALFIDCDWCYEELAEQWAPPQPETDIVSRTVDKLMALAG
jgi:hypothetical protein